MILSVVIKKNRPLVIEESVFFRFVLEKLLRVGTWGQAIRCLADLLKGTYNDAEERRLV